MTGKYFDLLVIVIALALFMNLTTSDGLPVQFEPAATGVSLTVDFSNGTIQEFTSLEGANVLEVTNSTTTVAVEWYGDLAFVIGISGVSQDPGENLYWQYWVNGDLGPSAANMYTLEDGDFIEWKLPSNGSESTTNSMSEPELDTSLIVGSAILGIAAVAFLVVIKLGTSRR